MDKAGWEKKPGGWENTHGKYRIEYHPNQDVHIGIDPLDILVVMAGGLDDSGQIYPWVEHRLDQAIEIYKQSPCMILCTGGGTYHKPPLLNEEKFVIHESTACAEYLITNGVDAEHIMREWASYDTIASVYFSLLLCVQPRNCRRIGVITSEFHMPRTKTLFRWIFGLHGHYQFVFISVNDSSMPEKMLETRRVREKASLESLLQKTSKMLTPDAFHHWLFTDHKAYSCSYLNQEKDKISEAEKHSY